jgi:hypothetical protein
MLVKSLFNKNISYFNDKTKIRGINLKVYYLNLLSILTYYYDYAKKLEDKELENNMYLKIKNLKNNCKYICDEH